MADQTQTSGLPRAIFEGSLDGIFVIDLDGRYIDVNPAGCRMFGYTRDEFLAADVTLLIFPEDREEFLAWDRRGWVEGLTIPRYRLRHKGGTEVWVGMTIAPLTLDGRQLVLGIKRDIGDAIRAEDALRESEARFRTLFDASTDAIFIETLEGKVLDCNEVACDLYGYTREELLDLEVTDLVPQEVALGLDQVIEEHRKGGGLFLESLGLRKDGTVFPAEVSTRPVTLGKEQRVTVFVRSVTDRRRAEEALRESEERYRTAIEHSNDGVAIIKGSRHLFVNRKYAEMFGYDDPDQLLDVPRSDLIHPDDRERVEELSREREEGRDADTTYECLGRRRDGGKLHLEVSAAGLTYQGWPASLAFLRDITDRKRLEEQLQQAQRMEAVGRLAGGVAHDFNNLLTAITGYGSLLLTQFEENDPRCREVEEIIRAGERATTLTDQLLVFSRRKVAAPKVLDLNRLVAGMENMLRRLIGENVALETVLDPGLEAIKVDPGQMEQVLMNLVVNAHQAMPEGGQVTVRTDNVLFDEKHCRRFPDARPGRFIRLTVEDTGTGLEPEVLDHIFEPFFTTRDSGTGLGLSLVYGIITQHEGWVEVNSRQERGTVFSIFLPRYSVAPSSERPRQVSLEGLQGKGERILLVEDEDAVRRYATQVLTRNGYQVFSASSAGEALKIFGEEQGNIRLVFSDQVLPGRSGLELVEQLRELKPEIGVLLTSGYAGKETARKRIEEQRHPFLKKPYGTTEILTRIRDILAGDI